MAIKKKAQNPMDDFINNGSTNGEKIKTNLEPELNQTQTTKKVSAKKNYQKATKKILLEDASDCSSFTTPINLFELSALRFLAAKDERSMRKMARRLWAKLIVDEAKKEGFNLENAFEYIEDKEYEYNGQFKQ